MRRDGTIAALETTFTRDHGAFPTLGGAITAEHHEPPPRSVPRAATTAPRRQHRHPQDLRRRVPRRRPARGRVRPRSPARPAAPAPRHGSGGAPPPQPHPAASRCRIATGLTYRDGVPITYDPADYVTAFDRLLERLDYAGWRAEQARARGGRCGRSASGSRAYVEGTGHRAVRGRRRAASIPSGTVLVHVGVGAQGQAHETTLAQICAASFACRSSASSCAGGDTDRVGYGMGTIASRVAAVAGPAVARSAREVADKARLVAAEMFECAAEDVVVADGRRVGGGRARQAAAAGPRRPRRRTQQGAGERRGPRPRRLRLLLPQQRHLGLRRPRRRGGGRSGDVHAGRAAPRGRARQRAVDQPHGRRGPGARRHLPGAGQRDAGGSRPRRPGTARHRLAHGLRDSARRRLPAVSTSSTSTSRPPSTISASRAWARAASSRRGR